MFRHNFGKCEPIYKIVSPFHFPRKRFMYSNNHSISSEMRCCTGDLVKFEDSKMLPILLPSTMNCRRVTIK